VLSAVPSPSSSSKSTAFSTAVVNELARSSSDCVDTAPTSEMSIGEIDLGGVVDLGLLFGRELVGVDVRGLDLPTHRPLLGGHRAILVPDAGLDPGDQLVAGFDHRGVVGLVDPDGEFQVHLGGLEADDADAGQWIPHHTVDRQCLVDGDFLHDARSSP
jgi:hypothetical protein